MQIESIVLYHRDGQRMHEVSFHLGELNVVTGVSDTGKTVLIEIVDYCLGSDRHTIYRGAELATIGWYGLRLRLEQGPVFVARKAPEANRQATDHAMYVVGSELAPAPDQMRATTMVADVTRFLAEQLGIVDSASDEDADGRNRVTATLRHALAYVFQRQRLVADPEYLFSNQDKPFAAIAIRDTLPYFLGAVDDDALDNRRLLRIRRRELAQLDGRVAAADFRTRAVETRVLALAREARDVGLIAIPADADIAAARDALAGSVEVGSYDFSMSGVPERMEQLHAARAQIAEELRNVRAERRHLLDRGRIAADYSSEAGEQRARLLSLQLLPEGPATPDTTTCPLCGETHAVPDPDVDELRAALEAATAQARVATVVSPRLDAEIDRVDRSDAGLRGRLAEIERSLTAVVAESELARRARSRAEQQAYVRGRLAAFFEEHPHVSDVDIVTLRAEAARVRRDVTRLEFALSADTTRQRSERALTVVGRDMTRMARQLQLGFSTYDVSLDPVALTVVADAPDRPALLNVDIGSGSNWVGYHVVTLLALHTFFVAHNSPVPRLLMIDQPTQAFFPSDVRLLKDRSLDDMPDDDQVRVSNLFRVMRETVAVLQGKLQIVVMDHAELAEDWFPRAAQNNWRDGRALVPRSWLDEVVAAD